MPNNKIKVQCTCGKFFETWVYEGNYYQTPFDNMCSECLKRDAWLFATRFLKLEKFRCVKCSWKLKKKDCIDIEENYITFKCKCCGYIFSLYIKDCY